jgi:hypothetical protein
MIDFRSSFEAGLPWEKFLAERGSPGDQRRWNELASRVQLNPKQTELLARFRRTMKILCMASPWCGDCARHCPIVQAICRLSSVIELKFRDRDDDPGLAQELLICGSPRIPQVVFLDEDYNHVGRFGDRTLAHYRELVGEAVGDANSVDDFILQDWLNEFERIQWLLRSSPRLRARHGD